MWMMEIIHRDCTSCGWIDPKEALATPLCRGTFMQKSVVDLKAIASSKLFERLLKNHYNL